MMKKLLRSILFAAASLLLAPNVFAATASPTGPSKVNVGQTFQVVMVVYGAKDVDTIRMNGSFTQDLFDYKASAPTGVFQNVSPGTFVDQAKGIFSFGAFTLSSHANGTARVAILTFKAKKAGSGYIQLTTTSHILSAGEEEQAGVGRLNIVVGDAVVQPEQPQPLPSTVPTGEVAISLRSPSTPNPDVWYATSTVYATWEILGKTPKTMYIGFDQSPEGPADKPIDAYFASFPVPNDGVWYVHLNVIFNDGSRKRADLRVQIDRQLPHAVAPDVDQTNVTAAIPNAVRFGTVDDVSGIARYELYLDGKLVTSTQLQAYPLQNIAIGEHLILVKAFDRAENMVSGTTTFSIIAEKVALVPPAATRSALWTVLLLILLTILFLFLTWIPFVLYRRRKKKKSTGSR